MDAAAALESRVRAVWESRLAPSRDSPSTPALLSGVLDVHLMLVAYGVENILKAALVRARRSALAKQLEPEPDSADQQAGSARHRRSRRRNRLRQGQLPGDLKTHSLTELAESVGFAMNRDEEALLRRLTRAAVWSGRYPIPVEAQDQSRTETFADGTRALVDCHWPTDIEHLKTLVANIRQQLNVSEPPNPALHPTAAGVNVSGRG